MTNEYLKKRDEARAEKAARIARMADDSTSAESAKPANDRTDQWDREAMAHAAEKFVKDVLDD